MSLTKEAIEYINQLQIAVSERAPVTTDFNCAVLPKGMEIVSLEHFQRYRNTFRASFETHEPDSFFAYCNGMKEPLDGAGANSVRIPCFIDEAAMSARVYFDAGTPDRAGHAQHHATLKMKETPELTEMRAMHDKNISQKELVYFIEDWNDCISFTDANHDSLPAPDCLRAIRNVKIKTQKDEGSEVKNYSTTKSTLEQIDADAGEYRLPAYIHFTCKPYEGLNDRMFSHRLVIHHYTDYEMISGGFTFSLKPVRLGEAFRNMASELNIMANDNLDSIFSVINGKIAY